MCHLGFFRQETVHLDSFSHLVKVTSSDQLPYVIKRLFFPQETITPGRPELWITPLFVCHLGVFSPRTPAFRVSSRRFLLKKRRLAEMMENPVGDDDTDINLYQQLHQLEARDRRQLGGCFPNFLGWTPQKRSGFLLVFLSNHSKRTPPQVSWVWHLQSRRISKNRIHFQMNLLGKRP